ncbi:uncharacterized protein KGF55_002801 [Candida pseudojiufengensis]|uniref:uncharacterized protein n=1 Tax=Candida pseudojiufengensis TaxID=497109 RepID=UPI0022243FFE|nr:uncharacterized protein KGF55_002801 [Candida pseudojiufengensis]KAI5963009.1 hypothetical protein KGF55_002801 [Candida pseudojiufengensis]
MGKKLNGKKKPSTKGDGIGLNNRNNQKFTVTTKSALKPKLKKSYSNSSNESNIKQIPQHEPQDEPVRQRSNTVLSYLFSHISAGNSQQKNGFSLYKLLLLELNLPSFSANDEYSSLEKKSFVDATDANLTNQSYEELINMMRIPYYLEKYMFFGLLICFNSFLTLFTLVPLKILTVSSISFVNYVRKPHMKFVILNGLNSIRKDIISLSLIIISLTCLVFGNLDISKMYHDVRGQADIKLYVMFGVLEVAEKLCSSIGQDLLNILFQIQITNNKYENFRFLLFYIISTMYLIFHSYILIYQAVSLNVAANSYSNALLTLLLSNQFSELKSSVFKKLDREGLFQITMADLSERFQLLMMLSIIAIRNLFQLQSVNGLIPTSWEKWNIWIGAIFGPGVVVIGSEIFVDWLKHCFISKFNKINYKIYKKFLYVSCLDFLQVFKINSKNDNSVSSHEFSDYIILTRRIGLPLLAAAVCFLRMTIKNFEYVFVIQNSVINSICLILVTFLTLIFLRIILVLIIFKIAKRSVSKHKKYEKDLKNKYYENSNSNSNSMDIPNESLSTPITTPPHELSTSSLDLNFLPGSPNTQTSTINPSTRIHLYDFFEKIPPTPEIQRNEKLINKKKSNTKLIDDDENDLSSVMRYEMSSKRIW